MNYRGECSDGYKPTCQGPAGALRERMRRPRERGGHGNAVSISYRSRQTRPCFLSLGFQRCQMGDSDSHSTGLPSASSFVTN